MDDKFHDVLRSRRETRPLAFGALWRIRGPVAAPGFTCRDIAALLAESVSSKPRKVLSAGWCEREQEDGGMGPAKFRAT